MTDDARPVLTEDERARIQAARRNGDTCAGCGRALGPDEPVWVVRFDVYGDGWNCWRGPVAEECAPAEVRGATEGVAPEACAGCGRRVYYQAEHSQRRVATCSKRCRSRYRMVRAREARDA